MPKGRRKKPFKFKLKKATLYSLSSVVLLLVGALIGLSLTRQGMLLEQFYFFLNQNLGWSFLLLPFIFAAAGLMLMRLKWKYTRPNVFVGLIIIFAGSAVLTRSGRLGVEVWQSLAALLSSAGAFFLAASLLAVGLIIFFNTSLEESLLAFLKMVSGLKKKWGELRKSRKKVKFIADPSKLAQKKSSPHSGQPGARRGQIQPAAAKAVAAGTEGELVPELAANLPGEERVWQSPPLSILDESLGGKADRGDVKKNAQVIEQTLESFGIKAQVAEVNYGPAVTQYALEIALGTKLSKITALSNDLALSLAAPTGQIRIEAPIPGRSLVGVEVPNRSPEFVTLKQILASEAMSEAKSKLTMSLGLNVAGRPVTADLSRMPHILIAGATGSGKTVCLNSFIATILFRASPQEVKLILIDPKRVEFLAYNDVPHLLTPVIFKPEQVLSSLKWAVNQMEHRYKLFAEVGVRNVQSYNEAAGFTALPYYVVIIDELADIMLFAPGEVEDTICRLAQMARATGIHLVVATQRPSVDVITGLIKANIPARIAFTVSSQVDSRVILDTTGAEKLLGRGDMLYIPPDQAKPLRIQGTFVSDQDIQKLLGFLKNTGVAPVYTKEVTQIPVRTGGGSVLTAGAEEQDELFEEALAIIFQDEKGSASLLQRRLKVGYARAARILDQMAQAGIVGPADGSKPRELLITPEEYYARRQGATDENSGTISSAS